MTVKAKTKTKPVKRNGKGTSLAAFRPQRVNANKHKPLGLKMVGDSIQRDGYSAPMVAAADGELFIGSLRHEAVSDVLPAEPIVIRSRGDRPIIHIREDIPNADDPRARRLGVADNIIAHVDYNPDGAIMAALAGEDAAIKQMIEADDLSLHAIMALTQIPPNLNDLEDEYGTPEARDFWPIVKVQVSPKTFKRYEKLMANIDGTDEAKKFDALLSRAELS